MRPTLLLGVMLELLVVVKVETELHRNDEEVGQDYDQDDRIEHEFAFLVGPD